MQVLYVCVLDALNEVLSVCLLYVSLGSRVRPSIFGCVFMSSVLLLTNIFSCLFYSAGSGVKRVRVVFPVLRMRLFTCRCALLCLSICLLRW